MATQLKAPAALLVAFAALTGIAAGLTDVTGVDESLRGLFYERDLASTADIHGSTLRIIAHNLQILAPLTIGAILLATTARSRRARIVAMVIPFSLIAVQLVAAGALTITFGSDISFERPHFWIEFATWALVGWMVITRKAYVPVGVTVVVLTVLGAIIETGGIR